MPIRKRPATLASLAVLLALSGRGRGLAEQPAPTPAAAPAAASLDDQLRRADQNQDGRLDEREARQAGFFTRESFGDTDRDRDGFVTVFELGEAVQGRYKEWLARKDDTDVDGDGHVSREEAQKGTSGFLAFFERADRDGDGKLSREELMADVTAGYYSETATQPLVPNIIDKRF